MALTTYVKSLNGYPGGHPFRDDGHVVLDSEDIYVTGSTGTTVKAKAQNIADGMEALTVSMQDSGDYKIRIGSYPLQFTTN